MGIRKILRKKRNLSISLSVRNGTPLVMLKSESNVIAITTSKWCIDRLASGFDLSVEVIEEVSIEQQIANAAAVALQETSPGIGSSENKTSGQ